MSTPKVTVVVPVYNAGAYLTPCLQSIAAQTMRDFTCVLVDDGSSDGSGEACDRFAARDERFLVLHQPNGGVSAARAAGVRAALDGKAPWVAFCDGDDLYHPQLLQTLLRAANATDLPIACCRYDTFTDTPPLDGAPAAAVRPLHAPAHLRALLHDHAVDFSLCNKLYRADLLARVEFDNGYAFNEDLLVNWEVFTLAAGCAFCDFAGYHYRQHAASASHRPLPPQSIDDQRHVALHIRENAPPEADADAFYYEKLVYLASMILRRPDSELYRPQLHELMVGIRAGLRDKRMGASPALPLFIKISAWATVTCPDLWRRVCRLLLKDRQ